MRFIVCLIALSTALVLVQSVQPKIIPVEVQEYIGKVKIADKSIRLLVLKHCPDQIANTDSGQAIAAANLAASKGLDIRDIGNYHIDKSGKSDRFAWSQTYDLEGLKAFVKEQMKVNAEPGDTLIVYSIGHGGDGTLMRLGMRANFMKLLAECAEENNQRVLWWQLSCHAGTGLPAISTLTPRQQELFTMIASSGSQLSYFCTQGEQMQKVFVAMAENSPQIDPNQDGIITAGEFAGFLNKNVKSGRGDLVFAKSPESVVFGFQDIANLLPIMQNGRLFIAPKDFVPLPLR